ncbi:sucrose-6-phosphate hydrolase [Domibacillus sp. DTU_2020_1001157_1_SI_ALB_TIR_016]|uniref:glycoside hydrolase family 32 protein n=1 Tax=Domibacillus sp. DTU_2020_1001157_1_SI_ALB_TIR_016 TaxID=3077789 RepID=UPI0028E89599|nr:sucrose-6-phosphate hydrolase [Domibacillus sp. DTU_2020_1001157_1_SI_ALB_TIR_016]WNS77913.1 sucrose-6-phosphate hydrolase [Domibacillus sp. DTU_2020_1001157_1_SI_ALB_TIR_016]
MNKVVEQGDELFKQDIQKAAKSPYRLGYHIMAPARWINDPNGLIYWNGEYHVFYQYHPFDVKPGSIHWGHMKSKDLVHWEHLPIAIAPDEDYDKSGCFSGSAVDNNGVLTLMYTGHVDENGVITETQCIAESTDGIHFTKHPQNPVIAHPPEGASHDFRDPKVWKHQDKWYMVIGSQKNKLGNVHLYESDDLLSWRERGAIVKSDGKLGFMLECPDFFELEGRHVLVFSPQGVKADGDHYQNLYQTGALIGEFDYEAAHFTHREFTELDGGFDFYAAQTFKDDKGRRILFGWMNMWEAEMPEQAHGWAGALTLPRELTFNQSGQLLMKPVAELQLLRHEKVTAESMLVSGVKKLNFAGDRLEIIAEFSKDTASAFGLNVRCSEEGQEKTVIRFDTQEEKMIVDRNQSGEGEGGIRKVKISNKDTVKLHVFIDRSSVELFVDDGETVMTSRIYPKADSTGVEVFAEGGTANLLSLQAWTLKDVWNEN